MRCTTNCLERRVRLGLERVGKFIGLHPWWFIFVPLTLAVSLGWGFCFLEDRKSNDIVQQFTPMDGRAKTEKHFFESYFLHNTENYEDFSSLRLTTDGVYGALIFTSDTSVLSMAALEEILLVDANVKGITIGYGTEEEYSYGDICAKVNGHCHPNVLLEILDYDANNINVLNLTFPSFDSIRMGKLSLEHLLGQVEVDSAAVVQSANALRLFYYLQDVNATLGDSWLNKFVELMTNVTTSITQVSYFTSISRQQEFEKSTKSVTHLFAITYFIAILFSVLSCVRFDNVRNKVWVACLGVISAGLAVLSSFGLLLLLNVPFVITVASSPFLILGIGIDDMFIMISCWQQTNVHDSVEDRLAATYKEAAISITITTLTDVLAFYLSFSSPFGSVQSFCLYAGTAILFCYLYNITFFGACLALNGKREGGNRHWLTCMKVPEDCPPEASRGYIACCVGGSYDHKTGAEEEHLMQGFFRKYYGPFLTTVWAKAAVIVLYIGYISVSVYGCTTIKEGIDLKNLAIDQSYLVQYYEADKEYFHNYGPIVMLAVNGSFPYWDEAKRDLLESCIEEFKALTFISDLSVSWLHSFERYAKQENLNITTEAEFKNHLQTFLQRHPTLRLDVSLANESIQASRFFLKTSKPLSEKIMLQSLRETAQSCEVQPLVVYHPAFIYYDQYTVIASNTIQTVSVATVVMLAISLILIPNPVCALWVAFAIVSVIVGVAGFMALLGINLDSISMINLVISIGFSVDFSAHISYTFVSSTKASVDEKVVDALSHLGYPILQGALSTILGVVVLSVSVSYIFRTFFTIMFLVISFGLLHGIAFIPVFLSFSRFCSK
ncbi:patched domain-containing protein 3 [Astyanax mexicanus]|uniref:patched domain-containing protein 3 n=1 Tax=Astyanax mexicanus TaxID=7994 RepID=UPI0020CAF3F6|nr:patched domain-containing protein 3 [Astyanax mexicanus]